MKALVVFVLAMGTLAAGEAPLAADAYRAAAIEIAGLIEADRADSASTLGREVAARGWHHGDALLAADPAFTATDDQPRRAQRLREVAARLETLAPGPLPDRALLRRMLPPDVAGDVAGEVPIPDLFTRIGTWVAEGISDVGRWIGRQLRRLVGWLNPASRTDEGWNITELAVVGAVVLIAAGAATVGVMFWRRSQQRLPTASPIEVSRPGEEAIDRPVGEWEKLAIQLSARGQHREAIRAWFNASLATAFALGRLVHRRGRTNWEYVAQAPPQAPWRATMFGLVDTFETTWYGGREASADDGERFRAETASFVRQVRAEPGP